MSVAEPDRALRVDEQLLHDADVARNALRPNAHSETIDMSFEVRSAEADLRVIGLGLCASLSVEPGVVLHGGHPLPRVIEIDGSLRHAGLRHHRDAVRGNDHAVGEPQKREERIIRIARLPSIENRGRLDAAEEGFRCFIEGPLARRDEQ